MAERIELVRSTPPTRRNNMGRKMSVCPSVPPSVDLQKVFFDFNEI